ncbi:hypothetical protein AKJ09_04614 [Labilithrix luteola]|uniref:Uncharacterized protein n=1 Tax=Labilithrix luteola TaxID=1391654 RepID=A0A0K1PWP0_9BACT|nr:hypothetical protein [Labilithrix luteola]AKU97950.1 hypothetical protein AKJ09_04614 [Labilithrix luteola]
MSAGEFRLLQGATTRASLKMRDGQPELALLDERGRERMRAALDGAARPSVTLAGPEGEPRVVIEVDVKGSHVLLRGPAKQESYLFQRTDGTSGVVLVGPNGAHRGEIKLTKEGVVDVTLFDRDGKPVTEFVVPKP